MPRGFAVSTPSRAPHPSAPGDRRVGPLRVVSRLSAGSALAAGAVAAGAVLTVGPSLAMGSRSVGPNHGARGARVNYPYVLHVATRVVILGRLSFLPAAAELLIHAASIASILVPLGAFVQLWSRT